MERRRQYQRKFDFITEKLSRLPRDLTADEFYSDALFYRLQVSIDAVMDVVAMLCKDLGITVEGDYSNIDHLGELDLFEPQQLIHLKQWNGLRNALVHKYNKIESDIVVELKDEIPVSLLDFIKGVEAIVDDRLEAADCDE